MFKQTIQQAAITIFDATLNSFSDAALDKRNPFSDDQRKELVDIIKKAYLKENLSKDLTKIKSILDEFGLLYSRCGGKISIIENNLINIKKKA